MRCCAHILNLIVKDGLGVVKDGVEKIRDSVAYWIATPKRLEKFQETAKQLQIPCTKKLSFDFPMQLDGIKITRCLMLQYHIWMCFSN